MLKWMGGGQLWIGGPRAGLDAGAGSQLQAPAGDKAERGKGNVYVGG